MEKYKDNPSLKKQNKVERNEADSINNDLENPERLLSNKEGIENTEQYKMNNQLGLMKPEAIILEKDSIDNYARIGTDYFKLLPNGDKHKWTKDTIRDDFGTEKLRSINKYDGFLNVPSNTDYEQIITNKNGVFFNTYHKPDYTPKIGTFETIDKLVRHIFKEQYNEGMEWLRIFYMFPEVRLHTLCLVSSENNTGKTVFGEFLQMLTGNDNGVFVDADTIEGSFNSMIAAKGLIILEETDKGNTARFKSKLKKMITEEETIVNAKYMAEYRVKNYRKFVILSNEEFGFVNIGKEDNRFWIRKISPFEEFIHNHKDKIKSEISAFQYYLQNNLTPMFKGSQGRLYLPNSIIENEFLFKTVEVNEKNSVQIIKAGINEIFADDQMVEKQEIWLTPTDLKKFFLGNDRISVQGIGKALQTDMQELAEYQSNSRKNKIERDQDGVYRINTTKSKGNWYCFKAKDFV